MRTVISLGGGVQSTLLALACTEKYYDKKIAEKIGDPIIIMSDTGSEKPETMEYVNNIIVPELKNSNIEHYIVTSQYGVLHEFYKEQNIIPYRRYRSCTDRFKITPINKKIKELGFNKKNPIKLVFGITVDEAQRMKPNTKKWIQNIYPLIDEGLSRDDCIAWYKKHDLPIPVKSGCFCCPFTTQKEWLKLNESHPELIQISIDLEENASKFRERKISLFKDDVSLGDLIEGHQRQMPLDAFFEDFSTDDECSANCFL